MTEPFYTTLARIDAGTLLTHAVHTPWTTVQARIASGENLSLNEFSALIADNNDAHLEELAHAARRVRATRFGNTITLYAPLYLSNHCINTCPYCGFNALSTMPRTLLTPEELQAEAEVLITQGHRHILLVAGETQDPDAMIERVASLARAVKPRIAHLAVEMQPLDVHGYRRLVAAGVDGVTLYQETYQREVYATYHRAGPKADFDARLAAIEAAGEAGMRFLNIGALLGLAHAAHDAVALVAHARYLAHRFWQSSIAVSLPRLKHVPQGFSIPHPVTDQEFVRLIVALRIALPDMGLTLSTRETALLRDRVLPLGITHMSAGSRTMPGGYTRSHEDGAQFAVEDTRTPAEVAAALAHAGFDPVFKDWESVLHGD